MAASSPLYEPGRQGVHEEASSVPPRVLPSLPTPHSVHDEAPSKLVYLPRSQKVQAESALVRFSPGGIILRPWRPLGQFSQKIEADALEKEPTRHSLHVLLSVPSLNVPGGHSWHWLLET